MADSSAGSARTLVAIPTYNEKENVSKLYLEILELDLNLDILFIDDNSPDGTGVLLDRLAAEHSGVWVLHRSAKQGIGSAHQEAVAWAYDHRYALLITMDADLTHSPGYLPDFIRSCENCAVVVGSRYLRRASLKEWNLYRRLLTWAGHLLTRTCLSMPYDATGAYRAYRLDRIPRELFELVDSKGYSFFFESLYALHLNSLTIQEISVVLPARTYGHSKMRMRDIFKSVGQLMRTCMTTWIHRERYLLSPDSPEESSVPPQVEGKEAWNRYWTRHKKIGGLYDRIASLYRTLIIKRALKHFTQKHFSHGQRALHAGCGSGQVDVDVARKAWVVGLDISAPALELYRRNHPDRILAVNGDIFSLPFQNESVDGIFNLGVMEHFRREEIGAILSEFHRVLSADGKLLIFWPPVFGISVIFLKMVHTVLNRIFKMGIQLHPREFTLIASRSQAEFIFGKARFRVEECYFGARDFFTHCIIVASKNP